MRASKLLIPEPPLQVIPSLATILGVNQAIILQQIHYWLLSSEHEIDGEKWIYNSYQQWASQFTWLKPRAIQKHILQLEKAGFLISDKHNTMKRDRTKWYRIDYERLNLECEKLHLEREESNQSGENSNDASYPNVTLLPETTTENTPKSTTRDKRDKPSSSVQEVFEAMRAYFGYPDKITQDPIPSYGREGKAIKTLLDRGFSIPDILECWMEKCRKADGFKSMTFVNEDIKAKGSAINKYAGGKYGHMVQR